MIKKIHEVLISHIKKQYKHLLFPFPDVHRRNIRRSFYRQWIKLTSKEWTDKLLSRIFGTFWASMGWQQWNIKNLNNRQRKTCNCLMGPGSNYHRHTLYISSCWYKGFITGFTSGFIIYIMGFKGVLFTFLTILPKEIIMVPCIIALGVNGIKFSLNIVKDKSAKQMSKNSLKTNFFCILFCNFVFFLLFTCRDTGRSLHFAGFMRMMISWKLNRSRLIKYISCI